jgi:hypothetical protein
MTETQPGPLASPPGHPDLDTLADYGAGVLDPATSTQLQTHVSTCTRCQGVLAGSAAVPDLLRTLPPIPMPPAIEARIFAALDAERRSRGGPPRPEPRQPGPVPVRPAAGSAPVASLDAARARRSARFRTLSKVAAALVLVVGAGTAVIALNGSKENATSNSGGPGAAAEQQPQVNVDGGGPPKDSSGLPQYDRRTLQGNLLLLILQGQRGKLVPAVERQRLQGCETAVSQSVPAAAGRQPVGVVPINFEGNKAYALAYVSAGDKQMIVVVSQDCTQGDPQVLYTTP